MTTHLPFALLLSVTLLALVACSGSAATIGPSSNPSDGAIIQVVQETRDQLRAEPGSYAPNTLSVNSAVGLLSGQKPDDVRGNTPPNTPPATEDLQRRYQEAKSLALDAELASTQNKPDEARRLLAQSIQIYPTYTALDLMLPLLADNPPQAEALCSKTLSTSPTQDDRFLIIQRCLAASPPPASDPTATPAWASPDDISWFNARLNPSPNIPPTPGPIPTLDPPK
jgi:hypothetical protein